MTAREQPAGLPGIDVSHLQGAVDWARVAASGVAFAWLRSGEAGWAEGDLAFRRNLDCARSAGVVAGAYHVFHEDVDPRKAADLFYARMTDFRAGVDLPPAVDFEWIGGRGCSVSAVKACERFAAEVHLRFGVPPILYTAAGYVGTLVAPSSPLAKLDLWVAAYADRVVMPHAWPTYTAWQWLGDGGKVDGVSTDCDRNAFAGGRPEFDRWLLISSGRMGPDECPHGSTVDAPLLLDTQAK